MNHGTAAIGRSSFVSKEGARWTAPLLLVFSQLVFGQRADENVMRSAQDAFGTSIGTERIGLYSESEVRGFSPVEAGNVRIEGLYFDQVSNVPARLVSGNTIGMGPSVQAYPFPAPTGLVDYALRPAKDEFTASTLIGAGPFSSRFAEVDLQVPVKKRISIAAGVGYRLNEPLVDDTAKQLTVGLIPRIQVSSSLEVRPFWSRFEGKDDVTTPIVYFDGTGMPPEIPQRNFGQPWAKWNGYSQVYGGLVNKAFLSRGLLRVGLFRADTETFGVVDVYRDANANGIAMHELIATPLRKVGSTSGEMRYTSQFGTETIHRVHISMRGRDSESLYGGADTRVLGPRRIGDKGVVVEPDFLRRARTRDEVRQITVGLAYEGRFREVAEISLSLQKSDYRKDVTVPGADARTISDRPWLYSGALAVYPSRWLTIYSAYTRGQEESGVAPASAINYPEVLPAIRTSQGELGLRLLPTKNIKLIAAVFGVKKPYTNVNANTRTFERLGSVTHKGLEVSVSGNPHPDVKVVAGALIMRPRLEGSEIESNGFGRVPIGQTERIAKLNLEYQVSMLPGVTLDGGIGYSGERAASALRRDANGGQLMMPSRTLIDIGCRVRFRIGKAPATLRLQMQNGSDEFGWTINASGGAQLLEPRRFTAYLSTDFN